MTAIEVTKLKLRCSAEQRERTRFAIEDGLRTAIPDDSRLVLLRKMRIAAQVETMMPARHNSAVRNGWLTAISGSRHGGDDGAANANCVWFASREEAEALLLSRLLAGRAVDAWYWKLALPDWCGTSLRNWVPRILSEAISRAEDRRVFTIARCFLATGATQLLIDMLTREAMDTGRPYEARPDIEHLTSTAPLACETAELTESAAATLVSSVPPELRRTITAIARIGGEGRRVAIALVRAWLLQRSPALALSPPLLAVIAEEIIEALASPKLQARRPRVTEPYREQSRRNPMAPQSEASSALLVGKAPPLDRPTAQEAPATSAFENSAELVSNTESSPPDAVPITGRRLHSAHAGLWLVIPSLSQLGFREWLEERPGLLAENPGSQLLREIARRHRVPEDDPSLLVLGPPDGDARPEWARLWRYGLDRWLRRTVGRRLHDLVNRAGELDLGDLRLVVHYPAADADIALRRRALDRDPGWTDWIGLSIRYNFGGTEDWL
jgi:hypothetical protein